MMISSPKGRTYTFSEPDLGRDRGTEPGKRRGCPWLMLGSLEKAQYEPARTVTSRDTELSLGGRAVPEPAKVTRSSFQT